MNQLGMNHQRNTGTTCCSCGLNEASMTSQAGHRGRHMGAWCLRRFWRPPLCHVFLSVNLSRSSKVKWLTCLKQVHLYLGPLATSLDSVQPPATRHADEGLLTTAAAVIDLPLPLAHGSGLTVRVRVPRMHGSSASRLTTPSHAVPTMPLLPPHTSTQTVIWPHDEPRNGTDGSAICGGLTQEKLRAAAAANTCANVAADAAHPPASQAAIRSHATILTCGHFSRLGSVS